MNFNMALMGHHIPVLLITSFVLFMAIPDLVQTFYVTMLERGDVKFVFSNNNFGAQND